MNKQRQRLYKLVMMSDPSDSWLNACQAFRSLDPRLSWSEAVALHNRESCEFCRYMYIPFILSPAQEKDRAEFEAVLVAKLPVFTKKDSSGEVDEVHLAVRTDGPCSRRGDYWVASHPSLAPLLENAGVNIVEADSNIHAVKMCASFLVHACLIPESLRRAHGLRAIHSFGSLAKELRGE